MKTKNKQPVKPVGKPFLTGSPRDERTVKSALAFFGVLTAAVFLTFLTSSAFNMGGSLLRIILTLLTEAVVLIVFFNNAVGKGTEAVARGEILLQRQEKGRSFSASEKAMCYHPLKGFLTGLLGSVPILICAILLAIMARRQITGYGALPSWLSGFLDRSEIGDALVAYTAKESMQAADVLRIIVRLAVMPFITLVGAENRDGILLVERLSPLLVLLPAAAYGAGYLQGPRERAKIHAGIAQSKKNRARKEKRARKARINRPKGPEQLN